MFPTYPFRAFFRPAIGLLGSLLILEAGLRTKLPNRLLPQPSPYYSEAVLLRDKTLSAFKKNVGEPEVVVIGSSVAYTNVNAEILGKGLGKRAFCLGLPALAPGSVLQYWQNHWKAMVPEARTVILVLRANDVLTSYDPKDDSKLMGSRIERGWTDPSEVSIVDRPGVPSLRIRDYYGALSKSISASRKPLVGTSFWNTDFGNQLQDGKMSSGEADGIRANPRYTSEALPELATKTNWLNILQNLKAQVNGRFLVVYSPDFGGAWPSPADAERWGAEICRSLNTVGIETVAPLLNDRTFNFTVTNYEDIAHLHQDAAAQFTEALVQELKRTQ